MSKYEVYVNDRGICRIRTHEVSINSIQNHLNGETSEIHTIVAFRCDSASHELQVGEGKALIRFVCFSIRSIETWHIEDKMAKIDCRSIVVHFMHVQCVSNADPVYRRN